ncbi:MAG TPA: ribosomal protein S18-alanine N-acetyltransferase [Acidimicrobiia bacterium]|nr:ribosomal protein S18-alanine N-acetyltransferase [Acidimicrobiia bacterium]
MTISPPLTIEITPMLRRHVRSVLRIEERVYPRPWSQNLFLSELAMPSSRVYLVARIGRKLVGYGGMMLVAEDGHVTTLAVDPEWHRSQIGTRLMLALTRAALARDAHNLTLEVRVANDAAQGLYRRFGFAPVGVRKGYYQETSEDALVMWVHDIDADAYARRLVRVEQGITGATLLPDGAGS